MSKNPKFTELISLFESNTDFSLTEEQYEEMTGAPLPKETNYLLKKSAVAKRAVEHGFQLVLNERTISFKKINRQGERIWKTKKLKA